MYNKLFLNSYKLFFACCFLLISFSCKFRQRVSLIVHHTKIYTANENFDTAEAMAIRDNKIIAIGSNDEILKQYDADEEIMATGKTIFPGFIDAHCHFSGYATDMWKCNLVGTTSFDEVIKKLNTYNQNTSINWIYGIGWDQNDWENKSFPTNDKLNQLYPNKPVFLKRIDGHAALVNNKALELAGVTINTKINGGSIEIINGKLTGILIDNAMDLVEKIISPISDNEAKKYFAIAQNKCFSLGLTSVQDCGISEHTINLIDEAQKEGNLKIKIFALLSDSAQYYDRWILKGVYKTALLTVGGFKMYADGALGSRGACLLKDYADKQNWKGFLLSDTTHFKTIAKKLINTNFQLCTHAIGDSGNRTILKIYSSILKEKNNKRWRIEHAQVVSQDDYSFFGKYNIIPSVQPTHATSDMYWAEQRLDNKRINDAYAYKKLLDENGWLPLGTDFPVEDISPFKTFYAAVFRQDDKNFPNNGFQINNALTKKEALYGMTIWAAKAAFEENNKGSLTQGKAADFIILDNNIMECKKEKILTTKVLSTYINGKKVYNN